MRIWPCWVAWVLHARAACIARPYAHTVNLPAVHPRIQLCIFDGAAINQVVLEPGTLQLKSAGPRRRGRPRISWAGAERQHAVTAAGGEQQVRDACAREHTPKARQVYAATVRRYVPVREGQPRMRVGRPA